MIAHVAAASEARGRVVLRIASGETSLLGIEAAICVAEAFESEVEGFIVEDSALMDLARHAFVHVVSFDGRHRRPLDQAVLERDIRMASLAVQRRVEAIARRHQVTVACHTVRDNPVHALAAACAHRGPWNVVALAEPIGRSTNTQLAELFLAVADTTGVVVVGPKASRTRGPVVLALEDAARLGSMLPAADRLAKVTQGAVFVLIVAEDEAHAVELESQVRLLLADRPDIAIVAVPETWGAASVVAEALRRCRPGFVLAKLGGLVVPGEGSLAPLTSGLECPLLLVR